jgi:hypothetical protein
VDGEVGAGLGEATVDPAGDRLQVRAQLYCTPHPTSVRTAITVK